MSKQTQILSIVSLIFFNIAIVLVEIPLYAKAFLFGVLWLIVGALIEIAEPIEENKN